MRGRHELLVDGRRLRRRQEADVRQRRTRRCRHCAAAAACDAVRLRRQHRGSPARNASSCPRPRRTCASAQHAAPGGDAAQQRGVRGLTRALGEKFLGRGGARTSDTTELRRHVTQASRAAEGQPAVGAVTAARPLPRSALMVDAAEPRASGAAEPPLPDFPVGEHGGLVALRCGSRERVSAASPPLTRPLAPQGLHRRLRVEQRVPPMRLVGAGACAGLLARGDPGARH